MCRVRIAAALLLISGIVGAAAVDAASLFDPAWRFRTLTTDHFVIYFHQGEERTGRRLARIAEETWTQLHDRFGFAPRRSHVVLVDQSELANGYATPLPRNTIVVSASWPPGSDFIGDTEDWLRLVLTHEFTHVVHLDRSEGWARVVRTFFGRTPFALPNLYLPTWQIEGLATYEESAITGAGRLHAGDFGAIVSEAARMRSLAPLDRVNGGLTAWPSGTGAYAYGLGFHQYLADRFGPSTLATLASATARRVPYTTAPVFKRIYGESLGSLWRDYESSVLAAVPPTPPMDDAMQRLTHDGYVALGPRFDRGDPSGRASIVYSLRSPDGFPALNRVEMDGAPPARITGRYLGSTTAIGRTHLYFDQQEFRRNVGVYSDLYALARADGRVTRLTKDARLLDPDLSPDGTTLACVRSASGQRDLVLVRLTGEPSAVAAVSTLVSEVETQFDAPRWSPDGRSIAVERHRLGQLSDVVLVDVATGQLRVLASDPRARVVTPAWRPDGQAVVAAIAFQDQPFNLYELSIDGAAPPRQLTRTTGGATWPDVSPDGRTIVFSGLTTAGADIFVIPYPDVSLTATESRTMTPALTPAGAYDSPEVPSQRYTPIHTLRPTSWSPVIESDGDQIRAGAVLGAYDTLGYHFYSASATWLVSAPSNTPTPSAAEPDWSASYAYDRWQPTFWIAASQATSFLEGPPADDDTPSGGTLRARKIDVGVIYPMRTARRSHMAALSFIRGVDDYTLPDRIFSRGRGAVRASWASSSAHSYGYSISPEQGLTAGATVENDRPALGAVAPATAITADVRAYLPSFARHHVLALRAAAGRATGDAAVRRTFLLGGPGPDTSVTDFSRDAISLLRGFPANTFAGSHVALANVDYRFPLTRPERGVGTWPFFLHTVHASIFADAGHTWTRTFRASAVKTSYGAELSAEVVAGYFFRFTATAGIARGHDGSGTVADRTTAYFRIGKAF